MKKTIQFLLVALAAMALMAAFVYAQQPDFSKVEIKTTKLADNFYTLDGQGGTIGVLTGPDGVFMVDSQFAPLSQKIAAAVKQISDKPIRFMVNTHVHGDHTSGDENFGKMGVTIIAREQLRNRLAHQALCSWHRCRMAPSLIAILVPCWFSGFRADHRRQENSEP